MNLLENQRPNGCVNTALGLTETEQGAFDMADAAITDSVEIWKPVLGWEGLYEVSSHGRVKSLARELVRKDGTVQPVRERILRPAANGGREGRLSVLMRHFDRQSRREIHVLVCQSFWGAKPAPELVAAHWDGNVLNNTPANLRWATQKENMADARRHGTLATRENGRPDAFSVAFKALVIESFKSGMPVREIRKLHHISHGTAYRFRRAWIEAA